MVGGDVDDVAPAHLGHVGGDGAPAEKDALEVRPDEGIEVIDGLVPGVGGIGRTPRAGVTDHRVDAPEALDGGVDEAAHVGGVTDVGLGGHHRGAIGFELGSEIVDGGVDVAEGEGDALAHEDASHAGADAVGGAGDDRGRAFERRHAGVSMGR